MPSRIGAIERREVLCPEETEQDQRDRDREQEEVWLAGARVEQGRARGQAVIVSVRHAGRGSPIVREVPAQTNVALNAVLP